MRSWGFEEGARTRGMQAGSGCRAWGLGFESRIVAAEVLAGRSVGRSVRRRINSIISRDGVYAPAWAYDERAARAARRTNQATNERTKDRFLLA